MEFTRIHTASRIYIIIMSDLAGEMLKAMAERDVALKRAREAASADESPSAKVKLAKAEAEIMKLHKQRARSLKKELTEAKAEEDMTDKQQARAGIVWPGKDSWYDGFSTDADHKDAQKELRAAVKAHGRSKSSETGKFLTQNSGFRGSNLFASRHAVEVGAFEDLQLFKLQSANKEGSGPTKILLPDGEALYFTKPLAWTAVAPEGGEESAAAAAAAAAARAVWVKEYAVLTALAGAIAICIL